MLHSNSLVVYNICKQYTTIGETDMTQKEAIQEIVDILTDNNIVIEELSDTPCSAMLDCHYARVCSTIMIFKNPNNVKGKVEVYSRDDDNTLLNIEAEHLEEGENNVAFAKKVYKAIALFI